MIALAALLLAAAPSAATDTPRAFLARLYARYEKGDLNPPIPEAKVYTPELIAQMKRNARLHGPEEVGLIDYDPVCQCQDMAELKARIERLAPAGPSAADAWVTVSFEGGSNRQQLRIRLARTPAGWRIADIGTKDQPSLLADLKRDNLKLMRRREK